MRAWKLTGLGLGTSTCLWKMDPSQVMVPAVDGIVMLATATSMVAFAFPVHVNANVTPSTSSGVLASVLLIGVRKRPYPEPWTSPASMSGARIAFASDPSVEGLAAEADELALGRGVGGADGSLGVQALASRAAATSDSDDAARLVRDTRVMRSGGQSTCHRLSERPR
jgi:hypothetical protein